MAVDYTGFVTALAATAKVKAGIARAFTDAAPLGYGGTHRAPNKVNKKAALLDYRVKETTED